MFHVAELYGRVLRVNYAQPAKIKGGDKGWSTQAVWADADDWCAALLVGRCFMGATVVGDVPFAALVATKRSTLKQSCCACLAAPPASLWSVHGWQCPRT
jgi:hypothetical protein